MLPFLIEVALKSTVVLVLAALAALVLRKRSATARHFVWTVGIAAILILPVVIPLLPVWELVPAGWRLVDVSRPELSARLNASAVAPSSAASPVQSAQVADKHRTENSFLAQPDTSRSAKSVAHVDPTTAISFDDSANDGSQNASTAELAAEIDSFALTPPPAPASSRLFVARAVLFVCCAGSVLFLLRITVGQVMLWRLTSRCRRVRDGHLFGQLTALSAELRLKHPVKLFTSDGPAMPMAWGLFSAKVLLPADARRWSSPHLRSVLLHELAHVERRDCLTQLLAQLATAVYWFNPLVWIASRQMRIEREQACDDRVLVAGTVATDYARHLLDVTVSSRPARFVSVAAVGIARRSQLESRIRAVLNRNARRTPLSRRAALSLAVCMVGVVVALGSVGKIAAEGSGALTGAASLTDEVRPIQTAAIESLPSNNDLPAVAAADTRPLISKALRGFVWSIDWSRDGRFIAFGEAGNIRIYDAATLKLQQVLVGHTSAIRSVAFSPDSRHVASCGADASMRIWNLDGSAGHVFLDHQSDVNCVAWSGDSKRVASAGSDGTVRIYHIDGTAGVVYRNHEVRVRSVAWSPDGTTLASGDDNHMLHLWKSDGTPLAALDGHRGPVSAIDWSPDGTRFASVCHGVIDRFDNAKTVSLVRIWHADGTLIATKSLRGGELRDVAWSSDGRYLASAGDEGSVRLWRPDGTPVRVVGKASSGVSAIAWDPSGSKIVIAGRSLVHVLTLDGSPQQGLTRDRAFVQSVAWRPDGRQIVVGCDDGTVRSFGADGSIGWVRSLGEKPVSGVAWTRDGQQLAAVGGDRKIALFDTYGNAGPARSIPDSLPMSVAWSPDGRRIAAGCYNGQVYFLDADTSVNRVVRAHRKVVHSVAWSPDGQWLASGGWDGTLRLWDADGTAGRTFNDVGGDVDVVAWSPDGRRLASGDAAGVRIRNIDGSDLTVLPSEGDVIDLRWSLDGTRIAAGMWDSFVQQWSADGTAGPVFKHHAAPVGGIDWSPDGTRLATGGYDSTLRVVDSNTGKPVWTAYMFGEGRTLTFDPSQRLLDGDRFILDTEFEPIDAPANNGQVAESAPAGQRLSPPAQ
ncbi:MAG: M56 family metallopeptidase [Planctomycetaceae bacterium]